MASKGQFREKFSGCDGSSSQRPASGMEQQPSQTAEDSEHRAIAGPELILLFPAAMLPSPASLLLKPSSFPHACPNCLLPGLGAQNSMPTPHGHGQMPLGTGAWGHGQAPGKAASRLSHHSDHQVSVASKETPILSFQGTSAGLGAETSSTSSDS